MNEVVGAGAWESAKGRHNVRRNFKRAERMQEDENTVLADAIAALQARVNELEEANGAYRRESTILRMRLNEITMSQTSAEEHMLMQADNTAQMLESASEALKDLRQLKRENRMLKNAKQDIDKELGKLLRENSELKAKVSVMNQKTKELTEIEHEYESMILEVLTPTPPSKDVKLDIQFMHSSVTKDTHSLPAKLQILLSQLQKFPTDFSGQRIQTKKQIVEALESGKEMIEALNFEIEQMKTNMTGVNRQKRLKPMIDTKMNHIAALQHAMNRFRIM